METPSYRFNGIELSEAGLQCAVIVHADGRREPLMGFVVMEGQTIAEALEEALPPGASLVIDHSWLPHYRIGESTPENYVCANCPAIREPTAMEVSAKKQTSSAGRWFGKSTIYGKEDEHATPYMTRIWLGRLRLHIFWRGDQDPDCHDHPWDFWTFPFTPYVEEVALPNRFEGGYDLHRQVVRAWRWSFRPATHTHRVLGRYAGDVVNLMPPHWWPEGQLYHEPTINSKPVITLVWRSEDKRKWGFLKARDGKWCWVHWKSYVFGGGKSAPCE